MNEAEQIDNETLARIAVGIGVLGVGIGVGALMTDGIASPWLVRAIALLIIAGIVFSLKLSHRPAVARYALVFLLVGFVAELLLSTEALPTFIPYLFIPIAVIAGLLLSPRAVLGVVAFSIVITTLLLVLTDRFNLLSLSLLAPPFVLTAILSLFAIHSRQTTTRLGHLLEENRKILRNRTRKVMQTTQSLDELQQKVQTLEQQLIRAKTNAEQMPKNSGHENERLYRLIQRAIVELNAKLQELEQDIERVIQTGAVAKEYNFQTVWQKVDHLRGLLINLEEIARFDQNEVELAYQPLNIENFISEIAGTIQALAREKNLEIRYRVPDASPPLQADPARLRQALLHILSNAVTYTDQGIIEIQVETSEKELRILVSDTGLGMAAKESDVIFEKFGRANDDAARERQGLGLGLSIAKRLIELHGGRIWVSSVLGTGSTFYVALPLKAVSEKTRSNVVALRSALDKTFSTPGRGAQPVQADPDATLISKRGEAGSVLPRAKLKNLPNNGEAKPVSKPAYPSNPPVRRMGPVYTRRFTLILLTLLFLISGIVAILAMINGPVDLESKGTAVEETATTHILSQTIITSTATPANPAALTATVAPSPTTPPTFTPGPGSTGAVVTLASPPPATELAPPTSTPFLTPSPTQSNVLPTATRTQTREPQSLTNTPTQTRPAPAVTATPEPILTLPSTPPAGSSGEELPGLAVARISPELELSHWHPTEAQNSEVIEPDAASRLDWSPGGQALFVSDQNGDRELYLLDPASDEPVQLTAAPGDDLQPAWSPGGRRVAFSSNRTGNFEIYTMHPDGSRLNRLTDSRGFDEWPVWSPDGRRIAFVSDRDGNVELYVMNADGAQQQRLTHHPADDWPASWSPDGQWLVFASNRDENWNLYLIPSTGGAVVRITDDPGQERDPVWSPDGRTLAFAYNNGSNWDIYTAPVPPDGPSRLPRETWTQVTNTPTNERYPAWR